MFTGKTLRLRRFFSRGRCVIVPMDHPLYYGPLPGVESPRALVRDVASTPADGVLLSLPTLGRTVGEMGSLAAVARLDGTHTRLGSHLTTISRVSSVEYAVASGADAGVLNVFVGADNEDELLRKLGETAEDCVRWGLPLVGEMVPIGPLRAHYDASVPKPSAEELGDQIALAARVGAELGADVIKTSYTGNVETFRRVVEGASVPVIVAGGPAGDSVESLLAMVAECLEAGAAGICIGRNVWQRPNRAAVLDGLCAMVHEGASLEKAISLGVKSDP